MITVFIRTIIIYVFLVLGMRLMGKRTVGELQPFEFTITLALADLACMPMQDISVPLLYGLVPLFVMFLLHYFITLLAGKSIKFRRFINGKPVIVINEDGIDYKTLNSLNVNVNDLLEGLRAQQFFSPEQVKYAVYETGGNLSILERADAVEPSGIPVTLIVEGKVMDANFEYSSLTKEDALMLLKSKGLVVKDVLLMLVDGTRVYVQPKNKKYFIVEWGDSNDA
ncbi:MAG: DUF421 domain-containing protein [Clostridia bacterium]|nr:DUF421 domain-containing protein [Clostridia bacterium]